MDHLKMQLDEIFGLVLSGVVLGQKVLLLGFFRVRIKSLSNQKGKSRQDFLHGSGASATLQKIKKKNIYWNA